MGHRRALLIVIAALLAATPAAGQEPRTDPAAAAALFQEGREATKEGNYAVACAKFNDSYRLDPAVGTLLNLADCNEHLGKLASAWQLFSQAVEKLPPDDSRKAAAAARVAALAPRLPRLAITLAPGAPEGTRVTRDGVELGGGSLGSALPLDPGEHVVVVTAPDRSERRFTVTVTEGLPESLRVEPGAPAAKTAPAPASTATRPEAPPPGGGGMSTMQVAGIVVGGAGVVGLGVAVVTGLILPGKQSTVDDHCDANKLCDAEGYDAAQSGETLSAVNTAAWIAGGIATGVGVTLFFLGNDGDKPSTALAVSPLRGGAGASLTTRF
jgi:hypothetical protein